MDSLSSNPPKPDIVNWTRLSSFAQHLSQSGVEPGTISESEWKIIEQALVNLVHEKDREGVLRLRSLFDSLFARDTTTGLPLLQSLDQEAINAARQLEDKRELGHLLGAKGHNLHRQGYHQLAITAFDESAKNYWEIKENFLAMQSHYMTSLCYRALGDRPKAKQILEDVIAQTHPDDPWRANPMQVMAWLLQDEGDLAGAEKLLQQALKLYEKTENPDLLVAGALADLGEVVGIMGQIMDAKEYFKGSLSILSKYQGQYERQEARTLLKYSELLMHQKDFPAAMSLLNRADDKVSRYGHYYDMLWQIELAKAFVFLREGRISYCLTKMRSVFRIRRFLGLSNFLLIQHVIKRYLQRVVRL